MVRIREQPEDFLVEEIPLYPALGDGPHTHLWVKKRLRTTDDVAREIARAAGVAPREVGYAGRKDRRAVARQWFSVPEIDPTAALGLELDGAEVLEAIRHPQKLRLGELRGNRFHLRLRGVGSAAANTARERLAKLQRRGLPNRFGRQRFGRDSKNVERGRELLKRGRLDRDRRRSLLMISALQSAVFNRVLELRPVGIDELLDGDVAVDHLTDGHFVVRDPSVFAERLQSFELSPTGPLFGSKMQQPRGKAAEIEQAALVELGLSPRVGLELPRSLRLYGDRRPLRVRLGGVETSYCEGVFDLRCELPPGSYVTVLVEELFPDVEEVTRDAVEDADEAH